MILTDIERFLIITYLAELIKPGKPREFYTRLSSLTEMVASWPSQENLAQLDAILPNWRAIIENSRKEQAG